MKKFCFLLGLLGLIFIGVAQNPTTLSLADCIRYAEQHSLTLQTAEISKEMSEISLRQSKLNLTPTISASASQGLNHSIGDGLSLNGNYGINMGMSLFNGLYNYNAIKQNQLSVQQSELQRERESVTQFSFLMVLIPILGEAFLELLDMLTGEVIMASIGILPLLVGFLAAFASGCFACRFMINIVRRQKLIYFAIYCLCAGIFAIVYGLC